MNPIPQSTAGSAAETHQLYLHLVNLKGENGESATDRTRLDRQIAESSGMRARRLEPAVVSKYLAGDETISADHLAALRVAVDRAHREATDPRFTWKPRWLKIPQGMRNAHPSITKHLRPHHAPAFKLPTEHREGLEPLPIPAALASDSA